MRTFGLPTTIVPPWVVGSPTRAAGAPEAAAVDERRMMSVA